MERALKEYHRVLKSRGRIAIVETDWGGAILNSGDIKVTQAVFNAWSDEGPNPYLPRRLAPLLRDAGFGGIQVEAIPVVNASFTENSFSAGMLKGLANTAVRLQAITRAQADAWLAELEALAAGDEYFFCVNRFLFTATK
jgi:hypothetical protein